MERILASPSGDPYYKAAPKGGFSDIFFLTHPGPRAGLVSVMEAEAEKAATGGEDRRLHPAHPEGRNVHLEFTL